jgi:hypothetical protein
MKDRREPGPVPLSPLEVWFASVITHPESAIAGVLAANDVAALGVHTENDLARVVTAGPRLSELECLDIYHYAYRARLVECLADDYPALAHALGADAFDALCGAYIATHPSTSTSLNAFGRHMSAFAASQGGEHAAFASDLAALEWAMVEVVHAPAAPTLSLEGLAELPPDRWSDARLFPSPTARIVHSRFPVNAYFQAFREDREPAIPARASSATVVYRRGYVVWRMDLTPAMAGLLDALFEGATVGDALSVVELHAESEDAIEEAKRSVTVWFREWVAGGVFAQIDEGA